MKRKLLFPVLAGLVAASAACVQSNISAPEPLPEADINYFRCNVQPVIAARCAFMECHGTPDRGMPIYAEQRYRLDVTWDDYQLPLKEDELAVNFRVVRGFFARNGEQQDLLSEKPLDVQAGGLYHLGNEPRSTEDVFMTRDDAGYVLLRKFIEGTTADEGCEPTEEIGI